jgi:uncharacterized phage protein gp47/JayE
MAYGVVPEGFIVKPLVQIKADIESRQRAASEIGPLQDQSTHSYLGQLNTTIAAELSEVWELGKALHGSNDPEAAQGVALDNVASLTGAARRAAAPTRVTCTLNLEAGTTVPAGSIVSVDGRPDLKFTLEEDVVEPAAMTSNVPGVFVCTVDGPVQVNAGTLTVIETAVVGWNTVTNAADGILGRDIDTDQQLRERRPSPWRARVGPRLAPYARRYWTS